MFWKRKKKVEVSETALRLDGKLLTLVARRYMDENGSPQEEGLGRGGRIDTANGHVILSTDKGEVFVNSDIASVECGEPGNLALGANIAGFKKVADVMMAQGVI